MTDDSILPMQTMIYPDRCFTTQRRRGRYRPEGEPCRGRETAGADLYISSISEPGRGGLIPESTEFGSPGGGASNLSLLPPSGGRKLSLLALQMKAPKHMIL